VIATIGLPGAPCFRWRRVRNAREAAQYRAAWLAAVGEDQQTLQAVRSGLLLTEREARRAKWGSGKPIYRAELGDLVGTVQP
jgi:hypothetical protein